MTQQTQISAAVVLDKRVSAIQVCLAIYVEIHSEEYQLQFTNSVRKEFIHRAMAQCGMTEKGAASYYQNCKNKVNGRPLYYNVKKKA